MRDRGKSGPEAYHATAPPLSPRPCDIRCADTLGLSCGSRQAPTDDKSFARGPDFPRRSPEAAVRVAGRIDSLSWRQQFTIAVHRSHDAPATLDNSQMLRLLPGRSVLQQETNLGDACRCRLSITAAAAA